MQPPPPVPLVTEWGAEVYISERPRADKEAEQLCFKSVLELGVHYRITLKHLTLVTANIKS